jgi:hypothetical protein
VEENHKSLHQKEGVIFIQDIFDDVFEEALGFRVSSEHGGGHDTAKEERLIGFLALPGISCRKYEWEGGRGG